MSFISKVPELSKKMGLHGGILANKHLYGEPKIEKGSSKREFRDNKNKHEPMIKGVYPSGKVHTSEDRQHLAAGAVAKIRKDQY